MSNSLLNTDDTPPVDDAPPVDGTPPVDDTPPVSADSDRPEWLPEKYKTPEDLAKAYKELESKLGTKDEEIRKALIEEIEAEAYKDRPEKAGDYQLPDIVDDAAAIDNDLLQWWSEHSFENGYSQEEFQKGIEMYASAVMGNQPDLDAERQRLGENADARITAASQYAVKTFGQEMVPAIERLFETADGIMLMEAMMEKTKDGNFSGDTTPPSGITQADLNEAMRDPRYGKDREYTAQVTAGFQKLYG